MSKRLGVYEDLPEEEYHADDALGSTDLKTLSKSTEKFFYRKYCKDFVEPSPALILGSALHSLILDGVEVFFNKYKIRRKARSNRFFGNGDIILSREDFRKLRIWYRKLTKHPASKEILDSKNIKTEVSYFWENQGIRFKCRFDMLINDHIIVDLKTAANTYEDNFDRYMNISIAKFKYHLQAAHYVNGLDSYMKEIEVTKQPMFVFLFIEKSLPFRVGRKIIAQDILDVAQAELDTAVVNYKEAQKNNYWVDPVVEQITLDDMPAYF